MGNPRRFDRTTDTMKQLHWLPVQSRIEFKIPYLTWKACNGIAPSYIRQLLQKKALH